MINRVERKNMFKTTIKIQNESTSVSNFESWSTLYVEYIGTEAEAELNYIRSDCIIDGKMKEESYKGWDNETKTAKFIHYHETSEDMRDYQLMLTENPLSVQSQQKLHNAGWKVTIEPGTAENCNESNKLHVIDEWALECVRPERRQEVLDRIISE